MGFELTADDAVEELTSKETFNVFDFVRGATIPTDDVTIYTDADAALKLAKIFVAEDARTKAQGADTLSLADDFDGPSEDEITALHERLTASALVFHLKGHSPATVKVLEAEARTKHPAVDGVDTEEFATLFNNTIIANGIVSVERPNGALNTDKWTAKMVAALIDELYISEGNKLFERSAELTYIGNIFDRAVSADFS